MCSKFMPCFDGPFTVTCSHLGTFTYTLELPNKPNCFPTFHASLLHPLIPNDNTLFQGHKLLQPGPVITSVGQKEWLIHNIIDEWVCGHSMQYLVWWVSWGDEENQWLLGHEVAEMLALNKWLTHSL